MVCIAIRRAEIVRKIIQEQIECKRTVQGDKTVKVWRILRKTSGSDK
jgi:hypothetical protein